jgi:hypothetical protein
MVSCNELSDPVKIRNSLLPQRVVASQQGAGSIQLVSVLDTLLSLLS